MAGPYGRAQASTAGLLYSAAAMPVSHGNGSIAGCRHTPGTPCCVRQWHITEARRWTWPSARLPVKSGEALMKVTPGETSSPVCRKSCPLPRRGWTDGNRTRKNRGVTSFVYGGDEDGGSGGSHRRGSDCGTGPPFPWFRFSHCG